MGRIDSPHTVHVPPVAAPGGEWDQSQEPRQQQPSDPASANAKSGRVMPMLHVQPSLRCLRQPRARDAPYSTAFPKPHAPRSVVASPHRVRSKLSRELIARRYVRHAPSERPEEPELTPVKGIDDQTI